MGTSLRLGCAWLAVMLGTAPSVADEPTDVITPSARITLPLQPHWVWVNSIAGLVRLVDTEQGTLLGSLSTGLSFERIVVPRDGSVIYAPEIYFSRGARGGTRTDIVTVYDPQTLDVIREIPIPPKRASTKPALGSSALTDDERFLLIYNFTPAQSVTVVDTASSEFVGEVNIPGCALIFPNGPRKFFSICADGTLLQTELDVTGRAANQTLTQPFFDADKDPVHERPVRFGDEWLFISFEGWIHSVRTTAEGIRFAAPWSLLSERERAQGWKPAGLQLMAVHTGLGQLYTLMRKGSRHERKEPSKQVWVHDIASRSKLRVVKLKEPVDSIQVSQDLAPRLYGVNQRGNTLEVHDALTGAHLRSISDMGPAPTLLLTP